MHAFLKIKIKSLASEAQHIRNAEKSIVDNKSIRRYLKRCIQLKSSAHPFDRNDDNTEVRFNLTPERIDRHQKRLDRARARLNNPHLMARREQLHTHRVKDVRRESRSSFIAYGFLRGLPYDRIEKTTKKVDWDRVESLVRKFGQDDIRDRMQRFTEFRDAVAKLR